MAKKIKILIITGIFLCANFSIFSQNEEEYEKQVDMILDEFEKYNSQLQEKLKEIGLKNDVEIELSEEEIEEIESEIEQKKNVPFVPIDLAVPNNERIQKWREQYLTNFSKKRFYSIVERARPYQKFIREMIQKYNLPKCLEYLPALESSFNARAVSKAGAVGMWQFMKNSVAPFGLAINEWVDERLDPWLSTDAALRKLKENYDVFHDWYLALAAYNAGLGAIRSRVKKSGIDDYWKLCERGLMPKETADYLPRFLVVAEILSNAEYYSVEMPPEVENVDFETVGVDFPVDIFLLGKKLNISDETMAFLNPALTYTITPSNHRYFVRVPAEKYDEARQILADETQIWTQYDIYQVKSGDTFYDLAKKYEISTKMIENANPKISPTKMRPGQTLIIPKLKNISPILEKQINDTGDFSEIHIVQKGDTLWNLSRHYNISLEKLAEKNGISINATLSLGMKLKVPRKD